MAAADHGGPGPDPCQLLEVPREEAWRRRARAEHPDSRPRDAAAPDRFRALAQACEVLGDPARRAAYDRALVHGPPWQGSVRPPLRAPGPPLRAGPVRVESPHQRPAAGGRDEREIRLAVLALRYLAGEWGRAR